MTDAERNKRFRKARREQLRERPRIQRETAAEITRLLKQAEQSILATLAASPTDFQQFILPQLQRAVRAALTELGDAGAAVMSKASGDAFRAGVALVELPIEAGGIRLSGILPAVDTGQLMAMQSFLTSKMKDVSLALVDRVNTELGLVAIGVQPQHQAATNVSRILQAGGRSRALTVVRTEIGRIYSVAAQQRLDQASKLLPGLKKQWRRSGKLHSRPQHDFADGQIVAVDQAFKVAGVKLRYPRDPKGPAKETINCGCESLPLMEHWQVKQPGRKPFSDLEQAASGFKAALAQETQL